MEELDIYICLVVSSNEDNMPLPRVKVVAPFMGELVLGLIHSAIDSYTPVIQYPVSGQSAFDDTECISLANFFDGTARYSNCLLKNSQIHIETPECKAPPYMLQYRRSCGSPQPPDAMPVITQCDKLAKTIQPIQKSSAFPPPSQNSHRHLPRHCDPDSWPQRMPSSVRQMIPRQQRCFRTQALWRDS